MVYILIIMFFTFSCGGGGSDSSNSGGSASKPFTVLSHTKTLVPSMLNKILAVYDFNQDGLQDVLYGGELYQSSTPSPIVIMINNGDGSFTESTSTYFDQLKSAQTPIPVTGYFNNDSILDFAIYDAGNLEDGQQPGGGYLGGVPHLYLSSSSTSWVYSNALAQANLAAGANCWPTNCTDKVHVKQVSSGDIDNDGDDDLYLESGGGYANLQPHFLINNGDGSFSADTGYTRISTNIIWGDTGYWRYASHRLKDMNNDGYVDLIMGQLRRINNLQDLLQNKIVYNNGAGVFPDASVRLLPYTSWNDGWTYTKNQLIEDFNQDGKLDILLVHERGNINPDPNGEGNTGRKFQLLIQNDTGFDFQDKTQDYFIESQEQLEAYNPITSNSNWNHPSLIRLVDLNGDGRLDLAAEGTDCPISDYCPIAYLKSAQGKFEALEADSLKEGDNWAGTTGHFLDIDGDGKLDFIYSRTLSGSDGQYGTADDQTQIWSLKLNWTP